MAFVSVVVGYTSSSQSRLKFRNCAAQWLEEIERSDILTGRVDDEYISLRVTSWGAPWNDMESGVIRQPREIEEIRMRSVVDRKRYSISGEDADGTNVVSMMGVQEKIAK